MQTKRNARGQMRQAPVYEDMLKIRVPASWRPKLQAEADGKKMKLSELIRSLIDPDG